MSITAINPFNGETIGTYAEDPEGVTRQKIQQTHNAFRLWKDTDLRERAVFMKNAAGVLKDRKQKLAELMALEMGKPVKAGVAEIEKCAWVCEYYADNARSFLEDERVMTEASKSYISYQPLGVVLAVMPWNFPFWQTFRFLAPALMAGNGAVLKHASNVPGCALAIAEVMQAAGFPAHIFQTLMVGSAAVAKIIENPLIKAVTLTGSTEAGMKVAGQAAALIKKAVLELGGSDPYIILKDADLELAAKVCAESRLINSGQSCIAAKRFIVEQEVADEFIRLFKEEMQAAKMGDPFDEETQIGPQAKAELRDELHQRVLESIGLGARCILGGEIPPGSHAFYPPTILTGVKPGMPAYHEEFFGPVASVITVNSVDEAIEVANDTKFGLGSAIFSRDILKAEEIAATRLEAGCAFVNDSVRSIPELPFGGVKQSGYGRELGSHGIREFVNIKTVYIR